MSLRFKFNVVLIAAFCLGFAATAFLIKANFEREARSEAIQTARVMLAAADAIRTYTTNVVEPLTGFEHDGKFVPASVPAFAAQTNFRDVSAQFIGYTYKEATLNPTNLADRATDWEADVINGFRKNETEKELILERETPLGPSIVLAHPLRVLEPSCLLCHSQPSVAPASMTKIYGTANGFDWKLNDIIGSQIISLPLAVAMAKAHEALLYFLLSLAGVFVVMLAVVNVLLQVLVIKPIDKMSRIATEVSLGNTVDEPFDPTGNDEVSNLAKAFNRMRHSLESAMAMLKESEI
jgi:protein-histidine pros-kinase